MTCVGRDGCWAGRQAPECRFIEGRFIEDRGQVLAGVRVGVDIHAADGYAAGGHAVGLPVGTVLLDESWVEVKRALIGDVNHYGVGVPGIDEMVSLLRNHSRRHAQNRRVALLRPSVPDAAKFRRFDRSIPPVRQVTGTYAPSLQVARDLRVLRNEIVREAIHVEVDDQFESGQGQRAGRVDHRRTGLIPPAAVVDGAPGRG